MQATEKTGRLLADCVARVELQPAHEGNRIAVKNEVAICDLVTKTCCIQAVAVPRVLIVDSSMFRLSRDDLVRSLKLVLDNQPNRGALR